MIINILYRGCVNSGNLGDDILFFIFKKMIINTIINDFNISFKSEQNIDYDTNLDLYDIYVIGGGSIIHPLETSYTAFGNNYSKCLFINGTGITDCNKINNKNVISYLNNNNIINELLFQDNNVNICFDRINEFHKNNKLFGGFRGMFEKQLYNIYTNNNINFINDIGLLSNVLQNDNISIKINSEDRKIILINPIRISGIDALKDDDLNYVDYNYFIDNILLNLSVYLINNGFFVYIADFTNDLNKYFYDKITLKLDNTNKKYIDYLDKKYSFEHYLSLIKQSYIVVGTRLHTNIISNSFLIPSINISYAIKNINYCITNNLQDYFIPTYKKYLKLNIIIEMFNKVILNYNNIQSILKKNHDICYNSYNIEINKMLKLFIKCKYNYFDVSNNLKNNNSSSINLQFY